MTASETAKAAGLASLKELSGMIKKPSQTLINWYNDAPELFDLVVKGAAVRKRCEKVTEFTTLGAPHWPVVVSACGVMVNDFAYTHEEFHAAKIELIEADSRRIREAIRQFYIFAGDL